MSDYHRAAVEIQERMRRVSAMQRSIDAFRQTYGVKPGESLWEAMFGMPFPVGDASASAGSAAAGSGEE